MYSNGGIYIPDRKPPMGSARNPHLQINQGIVLDSMMWEGGGATVEDLSGNGNHSEAFVGDFAWATGKYGPCLLTNSGGRIDIVNIKPWNQDTFSVVAWAKSTNPQNNDFLLDIGGISTSEAMPIAASATPGIASTNDYSANVYYNFDCTKFFQVAVTHDFAGQKYSLYTDGQLRLTDTAFTQPSALSNLSIGNQFGSTAKGWIGYISHIYVYNRALSTSEIELLYREPFCGFRWTSIIELASHVAAAAAGNPWNYYAQAS